MEVKESLPSQGSVSPHAQLTNVICMARLYVSLDFFEELALAVSRPAYHCFLAINW